MAVRSKGSVVHPGVSAARSSRGELSCMLVVLAAITVLLASTTHRVVAEKTQGAGALDGHPFQETLNATQVFYGYIHAIHAGYLIQFGHHHLKPESQMAQAMPAPGGITSGGDRRQVPAAGHAS